MHRTVDRLEVTTCIAGFCYLVGAWFAACAKNNTNPFGILEILTIGWVEKCTDALIIATAGFAFMPIITLPMSRHSGIFALTMMLFMVFETVMFIVILGYFIQGWSLNWGPHFGRKMYVYDEHGDYTQIFNDGTYVIKDNHVIKR